MTRHLPVLSVLHYVYGTFLLFAAVGVLLAMSFAGYIMSLVPGDGLDAPPDWLPTLLHGFGWVIFGIIGLFAVLNLLSGYWIGARRNRMGSFVTAAFNCLNMPLGIALAIFTFVVLSSDEVRALYDGPGWTGNMR